MQKNVSDVKNEMGFAKGKNKKKRLHSGEEE